jgi:cytochrome c-type biogenesis protein CcmH
MMFMLLSIAIAVIVVLFLLLPLFSSKIKTLGKDRDAVNVEVAAAHLSELKEELQSGQISEEQFQRYRLELEKTALEEIGDSSDISPEQPVKTGNTTLAVIIALVVPLLSLFIYKQIGSEEALSGVQASLQKDNVHSQEELDEFIRSVEKDVQDNPGNVESRIALGQVYVELERYSDAAAVYRQLYQIRPDDPAILLDYAEALALFHDNRLIGRPTELLNEVLAIEPDNGRALWLAGFASLQAGDREQTLMHWDRLLAGIEPNSEIYAQVTKLIDQIKLNQPSSEAAEVEKDKIATQSITVNVSIAPEFDANIDPNTTLFVFARAAEGPRMPLAVHKGKAKDLPLSVSLDDSMAMVPNMSLSRFPQIVIGARLSTNDQPQGQSGDYEGFSTTIELSETPDIDILINATKP